MHIQEPHKEIQTSRYCDEVVAILQQDALKVVPEQVREVLGGLSNLYLEALSRLKKSELKIRTRGGFASRLVPLRHVLREIHNCSGVPNTKSRHILTAMESALRASFLRLEIQKVGQAILFRPLGKLEIFDHKRSEYHLTYVDPAAEMYGQFLLQSEVAADERIQSAEALDLYSAIYRELNTIGKSASDKGLRWEIKVDKGFALQGVSHRELHRILRNLFANAVEAAPEGGIVQVASERAEKKVLLHVTTSSAGIDTETASRVFEPFFSTRRSGGGSGLGLAIANRIVKEHGGGIWVRSPLGGLTSFTVLLPQKRLSSSAQLRERNP